MSSLSSTSSHPSTSPRESIPDPATDMPTVWIPLRDGEAGAGSAEVESAPKGGMLRWIAIALFFLGGMILLAALIYLQIPRL